MVTNGMLLDKFTPQILDSRLNDIAVSMETVDKRKFESTRVGADLKSVMTAIINFSRLAKGLETAPKINVICAADLQDLTAIEGVVRFCSEHDLSAPKIYPLYVRFTGSGLTESIEVKDFERVKDILDRYYPSRTVPICREHRLTMLKAQGAVAYNEVVCREPWSTAVLRADGTFSRCNESIFEVENGSAVPGLVSSSLRTLWHSDEYFSIRLGLWHKVPPTGCIGCNAYELVKGISV
jgi:hypothetical protein